MYVKLRNGVDKGYGKKLAVTEGNKENILNTYKPKANTPPCICKNYIIYVLNKIRLASSHDMVWQGCAKNDICEGECTFKEFQRAY